MRQLFFAYSGGIIQSLGEGALYRFVRDVGGFFDTQIAASAISADEELSPPRASIQQTPGAHRQATTTTAAPQTIAYVKNNVQLLNEAAQRYGYVVEYVSDSEGEDHRPKWTVTVRGAHFTCLTMSSAHNSWERCFSVNKTERGVGAAYDKRNTKEVAARCALVSLGHGYV